jgi:xanthine dehydrogenase accessory factor
MFEIADRLLARVDAGERIVVATAVSVTGSAPRSVGTSMAVTEDGSVIGSISGGCVEGAVYELCERVRESGLPELERFGFSDETAFSVGLTCGGRIEVLATVLDSAAAIGALRRATRDAAASLTYILSGDRFGEIVENPESCADERTFTEPSSPAPRFIIFGAVEFAVALCNAAAVLGYRVTVCDPRPVFLTADRFPSATEIVVEWPTEFLRRTVVDDRTAIAVLSHDERFDADVIELALAGPAAYVGAMGSRTTHVRRMSALEQRGVAGLERLHSPIGLDIGARSIEETAISILAEVLAERSASAAAGSGAVGRLRDREGAVHLTS